MRYATFLSSLVLLAALANVLPGQDSDGDEEDIQIEAFSILAQNHNQHFSVIANGTSMKMGFRNSDQDKSFTYNGTAEDISQVKKYLRESNYSEWPDIDGERTADMKFSLSLTVISQGKVHHKLWHQHGTGAKGAGRLLDAVCIILTNKYTADKPEFGRPSDR